MTVGDWVLMGVWVLAFFVIMWLILGGARERCAREEALDTLGVRFARGEISASEYQVARGRIARDSEARV